MRLLPGRFARAWVSVLLGAALGGCRPQTSMPTVQANLPQTTPDHPWVVGLPATTRSKLETIRKKGLVFVHYDPSSDEQPFIPLEDCYDERAMYASVDPQTPQVMMASGAVQGRISAGFLSFASVDANLRQGLELVMTLNGTRSLSNPVELLVSAHLKPSCQTATHFIRMFHLGSWAWTSGQSADGRAGVPSVQVGANYSNQQGESAGDPHYCASLTQRRGDPNALNRCDSIIGIQLEALKKDAPIALGASDLVGTVASSLVGQMSGLQAQGKRSLLPVLAGRANAVLPPGAAPVLLASGEPLLGGVLASGVPVSDGFLMMPGQCYAVLASGTPPVSEVNVNVLSGSAGHPAQGPRSRPDERVS